MKFDFDTLQEEDSPYPEVRASVSNTDDPDMPTLTVRMWIVGLFLCFVGRFLPFLSHSLLTPEQPSFSQWHESVFQLSSTRTTCYSDCPPSRRTPPWQIFCLFS